MQNGNALGEATLKESVFLLRLDGKWVDFVPLGAASKPELWDEILFGKPAEVLKLLHTRKMEAEVFQLDIVPEALASWLSRTAGLTAQQRIDHLMKLFKESMRNRKR